MPRKKKRPTHCRTYLCAFSCRILYFPLFEILRNTRRQLEVRVASKNTDRVSHWLVNEQAISKAYVSYLKEMVSNPPLGSVFVFKDANIDFARRYNFVLVETENTLRLALNDQDAPQVVYNDSTLKSIHKTFPQNSFTVNQVYEVFPRE